MSLLRFSTMLVLGLLLLGLGAGQSQAQTLPDPPALPHHDALIAPPPSPALASGAPDDPRGPSQFMAGHVAVRVVLPESDGSIDPSTEDWSPELLAQIEAQIRQSLDWWAEQLPQANLRFSVRFQVVSIPYEPIRYGLAEEGRWIGAALDRLGYPGSSYFDQAYAAAFDLRDELGADWATTIIVANSAQNGIGYFRDGYFAYAYINGPFMVLTSDVGAYGTRNMAPIVAHELGHIFGALDQYYAARVACDQRSGYLDAPTTNSQYGGCGTQLPSIMLDPVTAYSAGQIDPSALAQLGYHDSDGDGLIDPLDTAPIVELEDLQLMAATGRPILSGTSRDLGFPAPWQATVSINTIQAIEYRVPGSDWQRAIPGDSAFDSGRESFSAELALYDGIYQVELRAVNSAGVASASIIRQVVVSGLGEAPTYTAKTVALTNAAPILLELAAPAGTSGVQISEDPGFAGALWQPFSPQTQYALQGQDGAKAVYVRFRDANGRASLAQRLDVTLDTTPPSGSAAFDLARGRLLLNADDATSGVTAVEIQSGGTITWQPYQAVISLDQPPATLVVRFRDKVGNISAPYFAEARYVVSLPLVTQ